MLPEQGFAASTVLSRGYFATADYQGLVRVWSDEPISQTSEFETIFGGFLGGLAINEVGGRPVVFAAALAGRPGVAAYDGVTGRRLWARNDLHHVLHVDPAGPPDQVAVSFSTVPMHLLSTTTGGTMEKGPRIHSLYASGYSSIAVIQRDRSGAMVRDADWSAKVPLPVRGLGVLAVAFGRNAVLVSDSVDSFTSNNGNCALYWFDLVGVLRSRVELPPGYNAPWLVWHERRDRWLSVIQDPERIGPNRLVTWERDGEIVSSVEIERSKEYLFVRGGDVLLVLPDLLVDTTAGRAIGRLKELPTP